MAGFARVNRTAKGIALPAIRSWPADEPNLTRGLLRIERRALDRDHDKVRQRDRVADHEASDALQINDDERRLFLRCVDLGDDRVLLLGRQHGQVGRDSGALRPAKDVLVRIGVDDDDGRPALGKDGREDGDRRGFAYAALGRADRNNGHLLEPRVRAKGATPEP